MSSNAVPWAHRTLILAVKGLAHAVSDLLVHHRHAVRRMDRSTDFDGQTRSIRCMATPFLRDTLPAGRTQDFGRFNRAGAVGHRQADHRVQVKRRDPPAMSMQALDTITGQIPTITGPPTCARRSKPVNERSTTGSTIRRSTRPAISHPRKRDYDAAVRPLFDTFDWLETATWPPALSDGLIGCTEADIRLWTNMDPVLQRYQRISMQPRKLGGGKTPHKPPKNT